MPPEAEGGLPALPGLAGPPSLIQARHNLTLREKIVDSLRPGNWRRTVRRLAGRAGLPLDVVRMDFPELAHEIRTLCGRHRFDVVQFEYTALGRYLPLLRRCSPQSRIVLEEIDISYLAMERLQQFSPALMSRGYNTQIRLMKRFERRLWAQCDAVVTMSDKDRDHLCKFVEVSRLWTVPNGVDTEYFAYRPPEPGVEPGARSLLFLGYLMHAPNLVGLRYWLSEVWPRLRQECPELQLHVVGAGAPREILSWHGREGVHVHGYKPDVRPWLASSSLMVVPLLSGSGTRLKILEAFSAGLPVVSTPLGAEGLKCLDRQSIALADGREDFVRQVRVLLADPQRRREMASNARQLVERLYSWERIATTLEEVWRATSGRGISGSARPGPSGLERRGRMASAGSSRLHIQYRVS